MRQLGALVVPIDMHLFARRRALLDTREHVAEQELDAYMQRVLWAATRGMDALQVQLDVVQIAETRYNVHVLHKQSDGEEG